MCKSLFLFEGRLYKCIYALSGNYVNEAIGSEMNTDANDYIDIFSCHSYFDNIVIFI